jgi:hypothetical protein
MTDEKTNHDNEKIEFTEWLLKEVGCLRAPVRGVTGALVVNRFR